MSIQASDLLEKLRQQFDNTPYPRIPLESFPTDPNRLYIHSLVTAYYHRNRKVISPKNRVILDAGCGTGYKSLELAAANPGAKIVGIDLSEESVKLARQRLKFHKVENVEFHAMPLEELPSLGIEFDYINNDEVLYLLPDPIAGLKAMQAVLKPDGILRTNFHSSLQRDVYLRSQKFFKLVGLMEGASCESDVELVRQTMGNLKDHVFIKSTTWRAIFETDDERLLVNHLLQGDRGWTLPEFFKALREAGLEFINMSDWRTWDLLSLFRDIDELPITIIMGLADKSYEEQLHLFELLHPIHRLLDVWCGHPSAAHNYTPVSEWTDQHWRKSLVHLHPQLITDAFKQDLIACVTELKMFEISQHLNLTDRPITIDSLLAACLLPLLNAPQRMPDLVERWQQLRPLNPITLETTDQKDSFEMVKQLLLQLETLGYILLECSA
ncbi:class I SAM-dependent methyltransferase [Myxacorys almedinensis]|uniref:Methyltransferase domain-containing protein n=1 Tax=Myxacorys almedinensis A TaxID=2690445 RepID=A0A8J7YZR2_9CYAN|nr:class I SAM-dependent methyltransferase [Myxacorys almedinensis]NDJ17592.1 methyltransferase domain-containing protein [Myxacorys almedinensis A]